MQVVMYSIPKTKQRTAWPFFSIQKELFKWKEIVFLNEKKQQNPQDNPAQFFCPISWPPLIYFSVIKKKNKLEWWWEP